MADNSAHPSGSSTWSANGTTSAVLPPDGGHVWWFADTDGDEFGHWVAQPWSSGAGADTVPAVPGAGDGYPAGLEIGRRITAIGVSLLLEYGGQIVFGAQPKGFPALVESKPLSWITTGVGLPSMLGARYR
mgnify:CR=1 FL=1